MILGWGDRWIGSGKKLISIFKFIQQLPGDEIILSVDPFDVIFLTGPEEIETKFQKLGLPFLCSALKLRAIMSSLVKALGYEACLSMKDFTTTRAY